MARRRQRPGEDGFTVIFLALTVTMLMGFAAIAIDIGAGLSERREDVAATDGSVLGALREATDADRRAQALYLANASLGEALSEADFNTCAGDPNALEQVDPVTNCLSYNLLRTQMRVRLPTRALSHFGDAVGLPEVKHSADATAQIQLDGFGGILPFALQLGAGGGDGYECLKGQSANVGDDECDGPDSGNFRHLDFTFFDATLGGTSCESGGGSTRLPHNIAGGVDHALDTYAGTEVNEFASCPSANRPNTTDTQTGNVPEKVGEGMWSGSSFRDGGPARLRRVDDRLSWGTTRSIDGKSLDNNPLWEFIPSSGLVDVPRSCHKDQFIGETGGLNTDNDWIMSSVSNVWNSTEDYLFDPNGDGNHSDAFTTGERLLKLLQRCFTHYNGDDWDDGGAMADPEPVVGCSGACTGAVFGRNSSTESPDLWDLQLSARFAYVPELTVTSVDWNGNSEVSFASFRAVFLQRVYMGNCGGGSCQFAFDPGLSTATIGAIQDKAGAVTAFVFDPSMLPGDLGSADAPFAIGVNRFVHLID